MHKCRLIIILLLIQIQHNFAQNLVEFEVFYTNILELKFVKAKQALAFTKIEDKYQFELFLKIFEDNRYSKIDEIDKRLINQREFKKQFLNEFNYKILKGFIFLNYKRNKVNSFKYFQEAFNLSIKSNNKFFIKFSLHCLLLFYEQGLLQENEYLEYLKLYKQYCKTKIDWFFYYSFEYNLLSQTEPYNEKSTTNIEKKESIFKSYDSIVDLSENLGSLKYLYYKDKGNFLIRKDPKKALILYEKFKSYFTTSVYFNRERFNFYAYMSRVSSLLNEHRRGINFLNEGKKHIAYNDSLVSTYVIYSYKANHFEKLLKYDSAYYFQKKVVDLEHQLNFQNNNQKVSELKIELDTEKKEKQYLEAEAKRKQNLLYLLTVSLLLILGSVIYILSYKNTKRKQKLAEQEKELAKQKNLTLLKEQEINTINAMVEGQEKERLRIAEDLHDNIGSVLATLKLHFENLKLNRAKKKFNQDELYQKTEKLIDETYLKVRKIAHAKNSGVIANEGLLVAVQLMAEKISSAEKIKIDVVDFGLDKRLENQLEITVFRIIQELTTNIIKHAEANLATINLSLYEKNLNIIIEDNGRGFDTKKIKSKEGIGLSSIEKRVKHLNGSFTIDSTINKGTSIIIDIPLS